MANKKKAASTNKVIEVNSIHGRLGGIPEEKALFDELKNLATALNKLGTGIQNVYNCKTTIVKPEVKIPATKLRGDDGQSGISNEKSLYTQLKALSSSLNKMTNSVQKNVQKNVKASAAAKKAATAKKKTAAKNAK